MKRTLVRRKKWISILMLAVLLCTVLLPAKTAYAAGIRIYNYNTNTTTNYTGTQVKYLYNGRTIQMSMPGIIIDNIALAAYDDLFQTGFGLTCTYNSDNGEITISEGTSTVVMTLGSKTANVNGTSVSLSVAPVKIKFVDEGLEKVYVPTRFVSENLGYSYVWTKSSSTAKITKTLHLTVGQEDFDYNGTFYYMSYADTDMDLAQLPLFSYHGVIMARAKKVFESAGCSYTQTENGVLLSKGDITLNFSYDDKSVYVNGRKFIMEEALRLGTNNDTGVSYALVPMEFTAKMLGFDLKYDDNTKYFELLPSERTGNASKIPELVNYQSVHGPEDETQIPAGSTGYFKWESMDSFESTLENSAAPVHTIAGGQLLEYPGIIYVYTSQKSEKNGSEIFSFASSDEISYVESKLTPEGILQVLVHNATSANYGSVGINFPLVTSYTVYEIPESRQVVLEFTLSKEDCRYTLALSEDKKMLDVIVYPDYLTKAEAYSTENADVLVLSGVSKEEIQAVEDSGMLIFSVPTAFNSLGEQFFFDNTTPFLNYCLLNTISDGTRISIMTTPDTKYYLREMENGTAICFAGADTSEEEADVIFPSSDHQQSKLPDDRLLIPLPDGMTKKEITDKDNYLNTNFVLSLPGNHVEFYKTHTMINPYSVIENYSVSYNSTTGYTNLSFDTKLVCGYKYDVSEGYLIVQVARPNEIYSKIVVLDAGHGGIDPGAIKNKTQEKALNFTILNNYAKNYFAGSDIKVYYTRLTDVKIDLYKRADFAAEVGADLFISLHMNANNSSSVRGTQVFYSNANNKKNKAGLNSVALAKILAANLSNTMSTKNRGASSSEFVVVKYNTVPAVLVELGFLTNSSDYNKLIDSAYQKKAAETIYKTVVQIFKEYPTGR